MQVGVTIPNNWGVEEVHDVLSLASQAEELGYDSVWVMDHLFHTGFVRERLDDRPYYHPLAVLSALSATTSRLLLGTSVMVLPYHHPVDLAKYVATLDHLARGRVILGVGAGALEPEFAALGIAMSDRRALTDESITLMKELWTSLHPTFQSERWSISEVEFYPKPLQQPHPPVWVGGASAGARRRAARLGDGWHPNSGSPEYYTAGRDEIRRLAEEVGRDPGAITMTLRIDVAVPGATSGDSRHRATLTGDRSEEIVAALQGYAEVGVEHVVIALNAGAVEPISEVMERLAKDVVPQLR